MIVFIGYTHVYKLLLFLLKHLNYDFNMLEEMDVFLPGSSMITIIVGYISHVYTVCHT